MYPRPVRMSIEIPVLDVSFARSQSGSLKTPSPEPESALIADSRLVSNGREALRERLNVVPESEADVAPIVDTKLLQLESAGNSISVSAAPPANPHREATKTPPQTKVPAAIFKNVEADSYRDTGMTERANHLLSEIRAAVDRYFIYPPLARRHGWQGTVLIGLRLNVRGQLGALHVVRSSGYAILDDDAIKTLERVGSIPRARAWLDGRAFETELTVIYRLIES